MNGNAKVIISLILLYLFWGFNWVIMRIAGAYFSPAIFVVLRFALGSAVLLTICAIQRKLIPPRRYWKWIALTGLLTVAGNNLIIQICTQYLGAGLTAVLNYTQSVFVCIIAFFLLGEVFTLRKGLGIALSAAGLIILMNINVTGHLWAMVLDVSAAALWGLSNVIVKAKLTGCDMIQYTAWQMTFGTVVLILYSIVRPPELLTFTPVSIMTVLYGGLLASAAAFLLFNYLLTHMEAGKTSIAIMAVPAVGVLSGIAVFQEPMTLQIALGMMILLAGVLLVLWQKR